MSIPYPPPGYCQGCGISCGYDREFCARCEDKRKDNQEQLKALGTRYETLKSDVEQAKEAQEAGARLDQLLADAALRDEAKARERLTVALETLAATMAENNELLRRGAPKGTFEVAGAAARERIESPMVIPPPCENLTRLAELAFALNSGYGVNLEPGSGAYLGAALDWACKRIPYLQAEVRRADSSHGETIKQRDKAERRHRRGHDLLKRIRRVVDRGPYPVRGAAAQLEDIELLLMGTYFPEGFMHPTAPAKPGPARFNDTTEAAP